MSGGPERGWHDALAGHANAAADFARRAAAVPAAAWHTPRAPGKWSPAQETLHLVRAYEVVVGELRGAHGMGLRLGPWQRTLLRWFVKPRLLRHGRFPAGVRAPREIRPVERPDDQHLLVEQFRVLAAEFEAEVVRTRAASPGRRVTHPFFGWLSLGEAVRFAEVHVRNHAGHLPGEGRA